ncbi:hypothetical protein C8E95_2265 [Pseudonocardia autotrophica]|uniref:Uncharacterized protein n=1 Tax=Pseudonocardia saturnea TaxID=33909 RepID=A0ABQ0S6M3_9PSEU|nr:hypothetical protein C8E95_2265 [Pseudonocardia autotrophica]BBG03912.1 hypothetical protein Pdca_51210 [Pseudonocardia autotrophica]GEC28269.1 hypothetical protein PSA01_52980 [Pseudonocardia saturnea]
MIVGDVVSGVLPTPLSDETPAAPTAYVVFDRLDDDGSEIGRMQGSRQVVDSIRPVIGPAAAAEPAETVSWTVPVWPGAMVIVAL